MNIETISKACVPHGLMVSGAFHTDDLDQTLVLLSPSQGFWQSFKTSPEYLDHAPDPIDRWSTRIITKLGKTLNAQPQFPFGGPPFMPFLEWAKQSGRAWSSPLGMLVHDTNGMMISYRGALLFDQRLELPETPTNSPCETCTDQPCLTACPVNAITPEGYQVDACHTHLDTDAGQTCMTLACQVRMACPLSVAHEREAAHNLLHMRAFKGET